MQQTSGTWRVPTKDELATLISPTCKNPAINEDAFPDMELDKLGYWTSTESNALFAWGVYFYDGSVNNYGRTQAGAVRLVRGGQ